MTEKIFQRHTLYYRSGLLLPDRKTVKFDLANEITISEKTFRNACDQNVLGYRLMAETLSEINIFCSCSRVPLRRERLVRRYRYRLHGLHRFDETFPRNITFLSVELNAQIHPRGLRFSIVGVDYTFILPTLYRLPSGSRSASLGKALNPPTSRKYRWYYRKR